MSLTIDLKGKNAVITGGHFPILTLGRLSQANGGYSWEPVQREALEAPQDL